MTGIDRDRLGRIEAIFHTALERPRGEREAYVEIACGGDVSMRSEVMRLLSADEDTGGPLSDPVAPIAAAFGRAADSREDLAGQRVGVYRLVHRLGEGGMGSVWLGERDDAEFERRVAIKVIKRGMDTDEVLRRFRVERRALAGLEHPSIARLIDAATTADGRPALVMEYVEGVPLDSYCESRGLSVRERLDLFLRVCDAVGHAHRQLVVHRDLKPSNIFVTSAGVPKLFDFGIAKLLTSEGDSMTRTSTEQRVLTPRYASPEQVRGERVTTATDVFSLGVVLYELLTGRAPFETPSGSSDELQRMICESEPVRPSTAVTRAPTERSATSMDGQGAVPIGTHRLRRELEGDLDTIVLMALRKEPERRYEGVGELAEDIRRHLRDLPVRARSDTARYRAAKFVRRNRGAVVAGTSVMVLLLGGFSLMTWMYTRTKDAEEAESDQRRFAEARLVEADSVALFLEDMLASATPDKAAGRDPAVLREILDAAEARVARELGDQPRVRARIEHTLGSSYRLIGEYDKAELHLAQAGSLAIELYGARSETLAAVRYDHAMLALDLGDHDRAERLVLPAVEILRALDTEPTARLSNAVDLLGTIALERARFDEADRLFSEAVALYEASVRPDDERLLQCYGKHAVLLAQLGRNDESVSILRAAIGRARAASDTPSVGKLSLMNNLAIMLRRTGAMEESLAVYDEIVSVSGEILGPEHRLALVPRSNRAALLHRLGRLEEAEREFAEVGPVQELLLGDQHDDTITTMFNHAQVLSELGRFVEAEPMFLRAIGLNLAAKGPEHPSTAFSKGGYAKAMLEHGDPGRGAEARSLLVDALGVLESTFGPEHPAALSTRRVLAGLDPAPGVTGGSPLTE